MSTAMKLSRGQKVELLVFVSAGLLLALGSILIRESSSTVRLPIVVLNVEYLSMVTFFAILVVFQMYNKTDFGTALFFILILATFVGLLFPPEVPVETLLTYFLFGLGILIALVLYYRHNTPSNIPLILVSGLLALQFTGFGLWFLLMEFQGSQNLLYLVGIGPLLLMLVQFRRALRVEYNQLGTKSTLVKILVGA